jgi:hypothetical protein
MRHCDEDLSLISGNFITTDLPRDKSWLKRYFGSDILVKFLVYAITFRNLTKRVSLRYYCQLFIDHTGCHCSISFLCAAMAKLRKIEAIADKAEQEKDLETLSEIKLGTYIFK